MAEAAAAPANDLGLIERTSASSFQLSLDLHAIQLFTAFPAAAVFIFHVSIGGTAIRRSRWKKARSTKRIRELNQNYPGSKFSLHLRKRGEYLQGTETLFSIPSKAAMPLFRRRAAPHRTAPCFIGFGKGVIPFQTESFSITFITLSTT